MCLPIPKFEDRHERRFYIMADVTRRVSRWKRKFTPERAKSVLDAIYDDMVPRYEAAVIELCTMEDKARQVLNASGVHTSLYVPYLDFARQLFKLTRKRGITGDSFSLAAQVLLEKWASRGLSPAVLAAVRTQVFDVGEPAPPAP
jgi:hypothetical protein